MDIALTSLLVLDRLARHCPRAISTYIQCVSRANQDGQIFFSRELVDTTMSESWTKFRNHIKELARENLITWVPFNEGIVVTLLDQEDDVDA